MKNVKFEQEKFTVPDSETVITSLFFWLDMLRLRAFEIMNQNEVSEPLDDTKSEV